MTESPKHSIAEQRIPKDIFSYVWRYSRYEQLWLLAITTLSFPIIYLSLEIPKRIINDVLSATDFPKQFFGFELGQYGYLIVLCFLFLLLITVSGFIKMRINVRKGVIAEKLVRRLRYQLIENSLRGSPKVSQGELIPIITAETGKLGGFFGDAISTPAFQGGTMLTILGFLMVQNVWLGLASIVMIPLQIYWIPKLQKRVNLLHRKTVSETRKLSNRIGDSITGIDNIKSSGAVDYFLSNFSEWLNILFINRLDVHIKKNFVKFLNNFINQITPFLFFLLGGILVLRGELTLGALVAGLAAYKDLTSPWKEVLAYYQATTETAEKYYQIIEPFDESEVEHVEPESVPTPKPGKRDLSLTNVSAFNNKTATELTNISLSVPAGSAVSVVGEQSDELDLLAKIIIGIEAMTQGSTRFGEYDYATTRLSKLSTRIGYLDNSSHVFGFSINDNFALGLKQTPPNINDLDEEKIQWVEDARATGNFEIPPDTDWLSEEQKSIDHFESKYELFKLLEIDQAMFFRGLDAGFYSGTHDDLENSVKAIRSHVRSRIAEAGLSDMIFPFHINIFNPYASLDENIIFGSPLTKDVTIEDIIYHPFTIGILQEVGIEQDLIDIGARFAQKINSYLEKYDADDPKLLPFSFIDPEYQERLSSVCLTLSMGANRLKTDDKLFLTRLAFRINPQRHDVDYFNDELKNKIITARKRFHESGPEDLREKLEYYDDNEFNHGLSVQCNLLFGRIAFSKREARKKVQDLLETTCLENDLAKPIMLLASEREAGFGGANLPNDVREAIPVIRELIKRPDILIFNRALRGLGTNKRRAIVTNIQNKFPEMSILHIDDTVPEFTIDKQYRLVNGKLLEQ